MLQTGLEVEKEDNEKPQIWLLEKQIRLVDRQALALSFAIMDDRSIMAKNSKQASKEVDGL